MNNVLIDIALILLALVLLGICYRGLWKAGTTAAREGQPRRSDGRAPRRAVTAARSSAAAGTVTSTASPPDRAVPGWS
jgi:hypothetical protein